MTDRQQIILAKLDQIGGKVSAFEIGYHLGVTLDELHELDDAGLVESTLYFGLTPEGKATATSTEGSGDVGVPRPLEVTESVPPSVEEPKKAKTRFGPIRSLASGTKVPRIRGAE